MGQRDEEQAAFQQLTLTEFKMWSCSTFNAHKMKFCIKDFFSKCNQIRIDTADLIIFTVETLNRKLIYCEAV